MTQTKYKPTNGMISVQEGTKISLPGGAPPTPPVQTNFFQYQGLDPGPFAPLAFPDTAVPFTGDFIAAMSFTTTTPIWFVGYWYYVCPNGGVQQTQKFALWSANAEMAGELIPGSVVTSGPLFVGWNFIAIPIPIRLGIGVVYVASTGVNGNFTDLQNVFGVDEPGAGGAFSQGGYAFAYSDLIGGNAESPYVNQGLFSTASNDPSAVFPTQQSNSSWFGMDVQLQVGPNLGYKGTYRIWDDPFNSLAYTVSPDNAVNYVVGTGYLLFCNATVKKIWYYSPEGTVQLATSADIWKSDGFTWQPDAENVYSDSSPAWSGAAGSGWVSVNVPNVKLIDGNIYAVTVYNDAAVPDEWSSKSVFYYGGFDQINFSNGNNLGQQGFISGPLNMPNTQLFSAYQYNGNAGGTPPFSDGTTEPGQAIFAVGPPNQSPYLYVDALFQCYYVEMEVE
jgi:hypothetical protein